MVHTMLSQAAINMGCTFFTDTAISSILFMLLSWIPFWRTHNARLIPLKECVVGSVVFLTAQMLARLCRHRNGQYGGLFSVRFRRVHGKPAGPRNLISVVSLFQALAFVVFITTLMACIGRKTSCSLACVSGVLGPMAALVNSILMSARVNEMSPHTPKVR